MTEGIRFGFPQQLSQISVSLLQHYMHGHNNCRCQMGVPLKSPYFYLHLPHQ